MKFLCRIHKKLWYTLALLLVVASAAFLVLYFAVIRPDARAEAEHRRMTEEYYNAKLSQYATENVQYADYEIEVAFVGDSLTDGYDLAKYYPQYKTANRGISGDTTVGLEKRLQTSLYDLKPQVVVMLIGVNNLDTMFDNYESILKGLRENLPDTEVVLLSLTAMGGDWGVKNQLAAYQNVKIKLLAEQYGYTFVDLFSALYDVSIGEVHAGYTVDGGHFTHEGYLVLTNEITPVLQGLLGK